MVAEREVTDAGEALLEVSGMTKRFAATLALDRVDFELRSGEVHMLLGENGAGKSTLIKILAGVYAPDSGVIRFRGREVGPHEKLPIAFIHQDLALADDMTVAENIALSVGYPRRASLISWRKVRRQAAAAVKLLGQDIAPDAQMGALPVAEKTIVAIARALLVNPEVLVLDEPTAALPSAEVEQLFVALRRLREEGVGMIYVTHRLDEISRLADRVTILRDGRKIATRGAVATTDEIVEDIVGPALMEQLVGRKKGATAGRRTTRIGAPVIELRRVGVGVVGPVSLDVAGGEIVGFVGLIGAGHDLVGRAITGDLAFTAGEIRIDGARLPPGRPRRALAAGVAFLSGKRVEEGILATLVVQENLFPSPPLIGGSVLGWISPRRERRAARQAISKYSVRPEDPQLLITALSGGNQQKVLLARVISVGRRALVLQEPTAGVDVGAKANINAVIREVADEGRAVVLVSSDFEEVINVCDRAVVFSRGQVAQELSGELLTEQRLIAATGGAAR
jgi:ribose transport system ATP-binding protein